MNSPLNSLASDAPLPPWACVAALIQAVLLFASFTLLVLA